MLSRTTRRWVAGLGVSTAAALTAMTSAGGVRADVADGLEVSVSPASAAELYGFPAPDTTTPGDLLANAKTNLTDGVTALVQELFVEPTNRDLAQQVSIQDGALAGLMRLESAEDAILAQGGSASNVANEMFFTPLNQEWVTASAAVLSSDHAFADAIANDIGIPAAQLEVLAADFQLLGAQFLSIPVDIAAIFFGADLTP